MAPFPGLVGGAGTTSSVIFDDTETINFIVEKAQSQHAQNEGALLPTPGFTRQGAATQTTCRGFIFAGNTRLFGIWGGRLFEIDANSTFTDRGAVANDGNPAIFVYNSQGGQLGIASGGNIYCYTLATNILSAALLSGSYTHIAFAAGQGFAFQVSTGVTTLSNINDLSVWNVGTFFMRGIFADPAQCIFADENNLLWTIGTDTFEVRYNSGQGTQPWVPLTGLVGPWGIASPFGFALSASGNFWVTRNKEGIGRFIVSKGASPQAVGTYAIDSQIDRLASSVGIGDAEVIIYDQGGHVTANVSFPAAQTANPQTPCTFSYDVTGDTWTKRGRWDSRNAAWQLWAPRAHVLAYGKHLAGDRTTSTLWLLDTSSSKDTDGNGIRRLRRAPHLNHEHQRVPIDRVELLCDVGLAVQSGQGSDPKMMLRVSTDGGRTWDDERQAGIGRVGEYRQFVYWTQIGAPSDCVMEFSYSEPVPFAIIAGYINNTEQGGGAARRGR